MVDFSQEARDQGCLHIVLKGLGGGSTALVNTVGKVLRNMLPVQLQEPKGTVLFLRFLDGGKLPCWAAVEGTGGRARWDQFSAHKCVVGLLCVAQCHGADDLGSIRTAYGDSCKAHQPGLCGSKCIIYGPRKNLESVELKDGFVHIDSKLDELDIIPEDVKPSIVEKIASDLAQFIFSALRPKVENFLKVINDPVRADPLPHLKAPMESKELAEEESEQRYIASRAMVLNMSDIAPILPYWHQLGCNVTPSSAFVIAP